MQNNRPVTDKVSILVVEDDQAMRELVAEELTDLGHTVSKAASGKEALLCIDTHQPDIIVTDLRMPEMDGMNFLREIQSRPAAPYVIMVTAFGSIDTAIKAVKLGAYDFITKPFEIEQLQMVIEKALRERSLKLELFALRKQLQGTHDFDSIVANSDEMKEVVSIASRICEGDVTVLLTGESGTGKELLARAIHQHSPRKNEAFVAVNLGALAPTMIEAELFGHEKGAYTDAHIERAGLFREANGGTIFLDEIGELPIDMQSKLLRVLQENEVRPLGSSTTHDIDVRVVAATNRDLAAMMKEGTFREDLFYRINVVEIELPPLRARKEDLLALIQLFWEELCAKSNASPLPKEIVRHLSNYRWPGNVRELRNVLERCHALSVNGVASAADLPKQLLQDNSSGDFLSAASQSGLTMGQVEKRYILHVLKDENGNKTRTAKRLGLDRKTLYRKLDEYGS